MNAIYLVEIKKEGDIDSSAVQQKARAADQYCTHATDYTTGNGGKPWIYVLIPHNAVMGNMSVEYLMKNFEYTDG